MAAGGIVHPGAYYCVCLSNILATPAVKPRDILDWGSARDPCRSPFRFIQSSPVSIWLVSWQQNVSKAIKNYNWLAVWPLYAYSPLNKPNETFLQKHQKKWTSTKITASKKWSAWGVRAVFGCTRCIVNTLWAVPGGADSLHATLGWPGLWIAANDAPPVEACQEVRSSGLRPAWPGNDDSNDDSR